MGSCGVRTDDSQTTSGKPLVCCFQLFCEGLVCCWVVSAGGAIDIVCVLLWLCCCGCVVVVVVLLYFQCVLYSKFFLYTKTSPKQKHGNANI